MPNQIFAQQTLDTINAAVVLNISGYQGASLTLSAGNLAATVLIEESFDNGINWIASYCLDPLSGSVTNGFIVTDPNPVVIRTLLLDSGVTHVRARVSSFTSGAAIAVIYATSASAQQLLSYGLNSALGIAPIRTDSIGNLMSAPSTLCVTGTATSGTGVTITLPNVAGQFHYITAIEITKYFTAANAASATPLVITTTNLPGSLAYSFGQPLGTVGTTDVRFQSFSSPIKSSVVNTTSTIVCPGTVGIIWRATAWYLTAP